MSDSNYKQLRPRPSLKTVKANLNSPGGPLNCRGQFIAKATVKGTVYHFRVIVVENDVENLLSRGVASRMNLMTRVTTRAAMFWCSLATVSPGRPASRALFRSKRDVTKAWTIFSHESRSRNLLIWPMFMIW